MGTVCLDLLVVPEGKGDEREAGGEETKMLATVLAVLLDKVSVSAPSDWIVAIPCELFTYFSCAVGLLKQRRI